MKKLLLLALILLPYTYILAQTCLPGGITFSSQSQIDNFATNYPGCTQILGDVAIDDNVSGDITNLSGLNTITTIDGDLEIDDNDMLLSLIGLDNLVSVGGELAIRSNNLLTSFAGLENVLSVGLALNISSNQSLLSFSGLNNLSSIGGLLRITSNTLLSDISSLSSVTSVGLNISLNNNISLTNLYGLDNIDHTTLTNLLIINSPMLSICEVQSICNYLANPANFAFITNNATGCNSRSEVEAACGLPLPVTISTFEARQENRNNVLLSWISTSEHTNDYYSVEHSINGIDWKTIGIVEGQGTVTTQSSYSFWHTDVISQLNYYRLRQVDFDGNNSLSKVIAIELINGTDHFVSIYPNPVKDYINLTHLPKGSNKISIFDRHGKQVKSVQTLTRILVSDLSAGIYLVVVSNEGKMVYNKFTKQ